MADFIIPGAQAVTQWAAGLAAACGEAALAVVEGIASGNPPSVADVSNLIRQGAQFGVGPTGLSTPTELQAVGNATGTSLARGTGATALATIQSNLAKGFPTILEVTHASSFGGSDANVSNHYVTVVGQASNGNFIVADANQPQAQSGGFIQYSPAQITAAKPFATLTPTSLPIPGGSIVQGIQQAATAPLGGLFAAFGTSPQDFAWRAALILGGMVLIVLGLLIFFGHQEQTVIEQTSQQVSSAAKDAATAAAAG